MSDLQLRPAQAKILEYENGRLAISAVPGSGKTFTLSLLAAKLIGDGRIDPNQQQILIVTYLNASVDNFKVRIRQRLEAEELPPVGFDVRTLHSLALEIVRTAKVVFQQWTGEDSGPLVLDEGKAITFWPVPSMAGSKPIPACGVSFSPMNPRKPGPAGGTSPKKRPKRLFGQQRMSGIDRIKLCRNWRMGIGDWMIRKTISNR